MLLEIRNIGKIQKASIEMRGITVIAGNNNTGKSTYGKILYCMFNAFCNAGAAIYEERELNIEDIIFSSFPRYRSPSMLKFINTIMDQRSSVEEVRNLLKEAIANQANKDTIYNKPENDTIDDVVEKIMRSDEVADEQIQKTILTRFLRSEFGDQIIHVNHAEEPGTISLTIKGNILSASIENNECTDFTNNVGIIYNALYALGNSPASCDALYMQSENEWFLIEFKNGKIDL